MKRKKTILLVVLLMAVGFAAVSTTLYINGQTKINAYQEDFNVYYSDAYINRTQDKSVIVDDTHILFTTELSSLGEKYELEYEVTNGSKNYDAELDMVCTVGNDYLSVVNEFDDATILESKATRKGKLILQLKKSNTGDDVEVTIECIIQANAVERISLGVSSRSEISVEAKDENNTNLNAKAYEITGTEEEQLLDSLVETGYVSDASEVDALIEVESDDFDNIATTTFDVSSIASEGDKVVILHFNEDTSEWEYISEETVDVNGKVTADFTSYSPVAFIVKKEDGSLELIKSNIYEIGEEIVLAGEKFNVIDETQDNVYLFAQYSISKMKDYTQTNSSTSFSNYGMNFSNKIGWEYTSGPKEIDIQSWSTNPKIFIGFYVSYLKDKTGMTSISGDLITLSQLGKLGCIYPKNYKWTNNAAERTCKNSKNISWIANGQNWWTKSVLSDDEDSIWDLSGDGVMYAGVYSDGTLGIRPVITISKADLENL